METTDQSVSVAMADSSQPQPQPQPQSQPPPQATTAATTPADPPAAVPPTETMAPAGEQIEVDHGDYDNDSAYGDEA